MKGPSIKGRKGAQGKGVPGARDEARAATKASQAGGVQRTRPHAESVCWVGKPQCLRLVGNMVDNLAEPPGCFVQRTCVQRARRSNARWPGQLAPRHEPRLAPAQRFLVVYRFWWLMYCTASTETTRMKAIMPTTMSTDHHCQEER